MFFEGSFGLPVFVLFIFGEGWGCRVLTIAGTFVFFDVEVFGLSGKSSVDVNIADGLGSVGFFEVGEDKSGGGVTGVRFGSTKVSGCHRGG